MGTARRVARIAAQPARSIKMRLITASALALLLATAGVGAANPTVTVILVETDPVSPAVLHGSDNVYVHVHYNADAPVRIWVRPYLHGAAAGAMTMGSPLYPAGEGEAFGWFAFRETRRVDSIHVQVASADSGSPFMEQAFPADFSWDGAPGQWHTPAAWVQPFRDREKAQEDQDYRNYMNQPLGKSGVAALVIFGLLLLTAFLASVLWPLWGLLRWEGRWRWFAAVPLVVLTFRTLKIAVEVSTDPTSHNLLPFEYLILGSLIAPYMVVVWLLRRKAIRKAAE